MYIVLLTYIEDVSTEVEIYLLPRHTLSIPTTSWKSALGYPTEVLVVLLV